MATLLRAVALAAIVLAFPATAFAKTHAFQPTPTNLNTVRDASQVTGLRVNLPKPDCASFPSDCEDITVLNSLDGFNIQPRIAIPFSAGIDLSTVSSKTVFLVGPGHHVIGSFDELGARSDIERATTMAQTLRLARATRSSNAARSRRPSARKRAG